MQSKRLLWEFLIMGSIVIFVPGVLCRRSLAGDPRFRRQYVKGGRRLLGVKLPCPECLSNEYTMCLRAWNPRVRAVHTTDRGNWLDVTRRYRCHNPECAEVKKMVVAAMATERGDGLMPKSGPEKREVTEDERACMRRGDLSKISPNVIDTFLSGGWSFSITDQRYMKLLPPHARLSFLFDLYRRGGATYALLDKTMICGQSLSAMTREEGQRYAHEQTQAMPKYASFAQVGGGRWPGWSAVGDGTLLSPPTNSKHGDVLRGQVKPILEAKMCSRGAKVLAWDGTFAVAGQVESEAKVLVSLLNETGHVLSYAAVTSEKWANVLPLFMSLRDRQERLGVLEDLKMACSDICCEGLHDPKEHVLAKIFPGIERAPYADTFHETQIVTDSMYSGQDLFAGACRKRSGAQASTMEALENVRKCAQKGCLDPGLSVKDSYIVDGIGPETGLRTCHKIVGTGKCESLHSLINRRVVSQAPRFSVERSDRELAMLTKWHNDSIDERRGIRKSDFLWGRTWHELQAAKLWTNVDSPIPGGNQQMPANVAVDAGPAKVGLWNGGKEVFGHEYLQTYNEEHLRACADVVGVGIDGLKKNTFVVKPAEEGLRDECDGHGVGVKSSLTSTTVWAGATPVGTPFVPTAAPPMSEGSGAGSVGGSSARNLPRQDAVPPLLTLLLVAIANGVPSKGGQML